MNLIEGLQSELNRCRELLQDYKEIGAPGIFGATMIQLEIDKAESMMATGDTVGMLRSYEQLKQCN